MRAGRWLLGGLVVGLFVTEWWLVASGSAWSSVPWFVLYGAAAVLLVVRLVRSRRGAAPARGRGTGEPLLGEVEDIALGRGARSADVLEVPVLRVGAVPVRPRR